MYLYMTFALPAYDIEGLIDYLDKDSNGFVGVTTLDKEINGL